LDASVHMSVSSGRRSNMAVVKCRLDLRYFVTPVADRRADQLLVGERAVGVRRVEQINPQDQGIARTIAQESSDPRTYLRDTVRLSHSSNRVGPRRGLSPGVRLWSFTSMP